MAVGPALAEGTLGARRGGAAWFLGLALGCGVLAGAVAVHAVAAARREVPVVVVLRAVPPLQRVAAGDVHLSEVPLAALPPGAERSVPAVVGQFARFGLVPGEVVTAAAMDGGAAGMSAADARVAALRATCPQAGAAAAGCRDVLAVTLPVSADQGFAMVRAGDRVDIAASYPLQVGPVAQVIATDVPVLERLAAPSTGPGSGGDSGWLVLGCSPQAALRLQLAESAGKVSLLLRPLGAGPEEPDLGSEVVDLTGLAAGGSPGSATAPPASAGFLPPPAAGAGG